MKQPLCCLEATGPSSILFSKPCDKDVLQHVDEVEITSHHGKLQSFGQVRKARMIDYVEVALVCGEPPVH